MLIICLRFYAPTPRFVLDFYCTRSNNATDPPLFTAWILNYSINQTRITYSRSKCQVYQLSKYKSAILTSEPTRPNGSTMMFPPARPPNLSSTEYDLGLWPPDPQSWPFYALASRTTCASWHQNRFIRFQDIVFSKFGNRETNGQVGNTTCRSGLADA